MSEQAAARPDTFPDGSRSNDLGNTPAGQAQMDAIAEQHDALVDQFLEDSERPAVPSDASLNRVKSLVYLQLDLEDQIKSLDAQLETAKAALIQVQEVDLPSALQEYGMAEIKMDDDTRITVKQEYYATIKEEKRGEAFGWLISNGHADLIKHDVTTSFTKGQDDEARRVMELLEENNVNYVDKKHVHPQTLRAFVREQVEAGNPIPLETFSVHIRQVAKIKREKK
jgi:transcriptional regulator of NAD metabolism